MQDTIKTIILFHEVQWCEDIKGIIIDLIANVMNIFGIPKVELFLNNILRNFPAANETINAARHQASNQQNVTGRPEPVNSGIIEAEQYQSILIEMISLLQRFDAAITNRSLTVIPRTEDMFHNTTMMQTVIHAAQSGTCNFQQFSTELLPYIEIIDRVQKKQDKHAQKMCMTVTRLDQTSFQLLPKSIRDDLYIRLS